MADRVVITGLGVLSSIGEGKRAFWDALKVGKNGARDITLFETDEFNVKTAGELTDFDPKVYMGPKGLRSLDRSTRLLVSAGKLAVEDSGFEITDDNTDDVGVSAGTTLGSLKSIVDFDKVTITEGPRYTNPALFPNTVINSPASQVSIWCNIKGFNSTISTGFTACIDAFRYAADFIMLDRAKVVYTGGVEELCHPTYLGFHLLNFLSGAKEGSEFINCPFDKRRNGIMFGEGAALIAFEELDHAKDRKANILAEVKGFGYYFDPFRINKYNPKGIGLKRAIEKALHDAQLTPDDIDYICANANSTQAADKIEIEVIKDVFKERANKIPISSIKSMVGETYSVSGGLALAACVGVLEEEFLPPTINYVEKDADCDLDIVTNKSRKQKVKNILINTFGPNGSHSCMIIGRYES